MTGEWIGNVLSTPSPKDAERRAAIAWLRMAVANHLWWLVPMLAVLVASVAMLAASVAPAGAAPVAPLKKAVRPSAAASTQLATTRVLAARLADAADRMVALAADDDIPGFPLPPSPVTGTLDSRAGSTADYDDVYQVHLDAGEQITFILNGAVNTDYDMFLFAPGTTATAGGCGWGQASRGTPRLRACSMRDSPASRTSR